MVRQFNDFYQVQFRIYTGNFQTIFFQPTPIPVVHFPTVAMALRYFLFVTSQLLADRPHMPRLRAVLPVRRAGLATRNGPTGQNLHPQPLNTGAVFSVRGRIRGIGTLGVGPRGVSNILTLVVSECITARRECASPE